MSLSNRAKRGINTFNRACNWKYRVSYKTQLDSYIAAYDEAKLAEEEAQFDAEINNQIG